MCQASITREPGTAASAASARIPEAGRSGSVSPGGIGIASVLPRDVCELGVIPTYKNFPSGAHATGQEPPLQTRRAEPPPIGIAMVALPFGTCAMSQRRSGEIV